MSGFRRFLLLLIGEGMSALGANALAFALGVWVFQRTGSAQDFGWVVFAAVLPQILLAPWLGVLIDRWPRRGVMLLCDAVAALCGVALYALAETDALGLGPICALTFVGAACACANQIAYAAALTPLLPDAAQRARANALVQLALAAAFVLAPLLGAGVFAAWGIRGAIVLDIAGFVLAAAPLALWRLREVPAAGRDLRSWRADFRAGIDYLRGERGLCVLLGIAAASNFSIGFVQVLFTPMVLSVASQQTLGVLVSVGGAGMVLGGVLGAARGASSRPLRAVCLALAGGGACMLFGALRPSVTLWGACVFLYFVSIPLLNASLQTLWQARVPAALQGRVFAVRGAGAFACLPLAYVVSPWLAAHVFEPALAADGALARAIGAWFGVGAGRGMALMFGLAGVALIVLAAAIATRRGLARTFDVATVGDGGALAPEASAP